MTEIASPLPPDSCRDELVQHYRVLLATPRCDPEWVEMRRLARERLAILGASSAEQQPTRRRRWTMTSHFRAKLPPARIKRG
jgi:hypothetical protein